MSGFVQSRYVLRPCFLDSGHCLAAIGSEDCTVRVYHLPSSALLHTFQGHTGTVNAVAAAIDRGRMATASDDHTIRIWQTPRIDSRRVGRGRGGGQGGEEEKDGEDGEEYGEDEEDGLSEDEDWTPDGEGHVRRLHQR